MSNKSALRAEAVARAKELGICTQCLKHKAIEHRFQCQRCIDTNRRKWRKKKREQRKMGYTHMIPKSIHDKVREDIIKYKEDNKMGDSKVARLIGTSANMVTKWRHGDAKPTAVSIAKIVKAGVSDVVLPEELRKRAVEKVLVSIDQKNMVKRSYRKQVLIPEIVRRELVSILDGYIAQLGDSKTWQEHSECREDTIRKLFYVSQQGG